MMWSARHKTRGPSNEPRRVAQWLVRKQPELLGSSQVTLQQIEQLVARALRGPSIDLDTVDDLQTVSEDVLVAVKDRMNEEFEKNLVRPDDPQYQYNRAVDFAGGEEPSDWDD